MITQRALVSCQRTKPPLALPLNRRGVSEQPLQTVILYPSKRSHTAASPLASTLSDMCRKITGTFGDSRQEPCGPEIDFRVLIQTEPLCLVHYCVSHFFLCFKINASMQIISLTCHTSFKTFPKIVLGSETTENNLKYNLAKESNTMKLSSTLILL